MLPALGGARGRQLTPAGPWRARAEPAWSDAQRSESALAEHHARGRHAIVCRLAGASRAAETARAVQLHRGPLRWLRSLQHGAWPGNGRSNAPTDGGPRPVVPISGGVRRDIVSGVHPDVCTTTGIAGRPASWLDPRCVGVSASWLDPGFFSETTFLQPAARTRWGCPSLASAPRRDPDRFVENEAYVLVAVLAESPRIQQDVAQFRVLVHEPVDHTLGLNLPNRFYTRGNPGRGPLWQACQHRAPQ